MLFGKVVLNISVDPHPSFPLLTTKTPSHSRLDDRETLGSQDLLQRVKALDATRVAVFLRCSCRAHLQHHCLLSCNSRSASARLQASALAGAGRNHDKPFHNKVMD